MTRETDHPADLLGHLATLRSDERAPFVRSFDDPEALLTRLAEAAERMAIEDPGRALELTMVVMKTADDVDDVSGRVRSRRARAQALAYASRFEEALDVLDDAFALADSAGDAIGTAHIRMTRLHALAKLGRYEEAIEAGETARRSFIASNALALAARTDINLGVTHRMRDDPEAAIHHFDRARPGVREEPVILAQLDSNRAEALLDLCRFSEAEQAFHDAMKTFNTMDIAHASAIVEGNLGDLMSRQGRLQGALYHFERARRRLDQAESPGELARLLAEQADASAAAGLLTDAALGYRDAIPQLEAHGLAWDAARGHAGLGQTLLRLGEHASAADALAKARAAFTALGHRTGCARTHLLEGMLAHAGGDADNARHHLSSALEQLGDRSADAVLARTGLALLAIEADDLDAAELMLAKAMEMAGALGLAPRLIDIHHARGRLRRRQGRHDDAVADFRAATDQIERLRGRLASDRFRMAFLGHQLGVHDDLIETLLEQPGDTATSAAFAVAEQARSRSLLDLMNGAVELIDHLHEHSTDPDEARLLERLARLHGELTALYRRPDELHEADVEPRRRATWQEAIDRSERELQVIEGRLAATRGVGTLFALPPPLQAIQAALPAGTALLAHYFVHDELIAFVLRDDGVHVKRHLASRAEVGDLVERFRFQITRAVARHARGASITDRLTEDARLDLAELYDAVYAPVRSAIDGVDRLFIVPHGPLHALPYQALHDGTCHLGEVLELVNVPSASLLQHLLARGDERIQGAARCLVAGVSDTAAPHIGREVEAVAAVLPGATVLENEDATVERFVTEAGRSSLVHLACHGRFSSSNPLASGLKLADGWLTLREIYRMKLDGATVVLSGCHTGAVDVERGDELLGLMRAFFAAGAASLVMSLWRVNDENTAELMASFHQAWQNGGGERRTTVAEALRDAQCRMMRQQQHPLFWSPFVVVGRT